MTSTETPVDLCVVGASLSIATTQYASSCSQDAAAQILDHVQLDLQIGGVEEEGLHAFRLTADQTRALTSWLRRASAAPAGAIGQAKDGGVSWVALERTASGLALIFRDEEDIDTYPLSLSDAGPLADALDQTLAALALHPPLEIADHLAGRIAGAYSGGTPASLSVVVENGVFNAEAPRITLGLSGTWWLVDFEVEALADAFDAAAGAPGEHLALYEGGNPQAWMCVRRLQERVEFRLLDEMVEESEADGIFWTDIEGARSFSRALREALIYQVLHAAHIFAPPEPCQREVVQIQFAP